MSHYPAPRLVVARLKDNEQSGWYMPPWPVYNVHFTFNSFHSTVSFIKQQIKQIRNKIQTNVHLAIWIREEFFVLKPRAPHKQTTFARGVPHASRGGGFVSKFSRNFGEVWTSRASWLASQYPGYITYWPPQMSSASAEPANGRPGPRLHSGSERGAVASALPLRRSITALHPISAA